MSTDRFARVSRLLVVLCVLLSFLGAGTTLSVAVAADDPKYHSSVGPPDSIPKEWEQDIVGLDSEGKYCLVDQIDDRAKCHRPGPGDPPIPGRTIPCEATAPGTALRRIRRRPRSAIWRGGGRTSLTSSGRTTNPSTSTSPTVW